MNIKQYLEDNKISIYKVANSAMVAYPTVFNIVHVKVDILNCALGIVKKIADALNLSIDELLTLCDKNQSFDLFRSEQCHLVNRMGEIDYVIDLLEKKKIDYYWKLDMKPEAFYLLAMLDYLSKRNDLLSAKIMRKSDGISLRKQSIRLIQSCQKNCLGRMRTKRLWNTLFQSS